MILVVTRLHLWCEWEDTAERTRGTPRKRWVTTSSDEEKGARFHCYKQKLLPSQWKLSLSFPALPLIRCHSWHKHKREKERSIKSRKRKQVTYYWPWMEKEEIDRYIGLCLCLWGTESKSLSTLWWQSLHSFNILTLFVLFSPQWFKNSLVPQTSTNI